VAQEKVDDAKKLKVFLANRGNPDFGQHDHLPMPETKSDFWVTVRDFAEASKVCRDYINEFELGGGHWTGGKIMQSEKEIARVSYNGKVWMPGKWDTDTKKLYDPGDSVAVSARSAAEKDEEKTVHVVAWEYDTGGGFDWYHTAVGADEAFEEEKSNAEDLKKENWTAFRFDVVVSNALTSDEITSEIDGDIESLCDNAPIKFKAEKDVLHPAPKM